MHLAVLTWLVLGLGPGESFVGPERDLGSTGLVDARDEQMCTTVAASGSGYLAAWWDDRHYFDYGVFAGRISPDGEPLDPTGIPVCIRADGTSAPAVASDGTDYLVAWTDPRSEGAVYVARVLANGTVVEDCGFPVAAPAPGSLKNTGRLALVFDGTQYVVVWLVRNLDANRLDLRLARIARDGTVLDPQGRDLFELPQAGTFSLSRATTGAMLAWTSLDGGQYLLNFSRVGSDGVVRDAPPASTPLAGSPRRLSSLSVGARAVAVVESSSTGGLGAIGWDPPAPPGSEVSHAASPLGQGDYARGHFVPATAQGARVLLQLGDDGTELGPPIVLREADSGFPYCQDWAAARGNDVMAVLDEGAPGSVPVGVVSVLVPDGGTPAPGRRLSLSAPSASPGLHSAGASSSLLLWHESGRGLTGRMLLRDGGASVPPVVSLLTDAGATVATVRTAPFGSGHLVSWSDALGFRIAFVDSDGAPVTLATPSLVPGTALMSMAPGQDRALLVLRFPDGDGGFTFLFPDGGTGPIGPLQVSPSASFATAFDGTTWNVVSTPGSAGGLTLQRVHSDGGVASSQPQVLLDGGSPVLWVQALSIGGELVVASSGLNTVSMLRVSPDGQVTPGWATAFDGGQVQALAMAGLDGGALLAWSHWPSAGWDGLWGLRFGANLEPLDSEPFRLIPEGLVWGPPMLAPESSGVRVAYIRFVREAPYTAMRLRDRLWFGPGTSGPRRYLVGCGCEAVPPAATAALLVLAVLRRRRR